MLFPLGWTKSFTRFGSEAKLMEARLLAKLVPKRSMRNNTLPSLVSSRFVVHEEGNDPTRVRSLNKLIWAYGKDGRSDEARKVFEAMTKRNVFSWNAMITAYARNGHLEDARTTFEAMPCERDVVSWTALITAYAQNGMGNASFLLLQSMRETGVKPDVVTFVSVLDGISTLSKGKLIHAWVSSSRFETDVVILTALITMYGKCMSPEESARVFARTPVRNVVAWTAMTAAYARNGLVEAAWGVFRNSPSHNVVSWTTMISAFAQNGHPKQAIKLFNEMGSNGVKPNKVTLLALIDAIVNMEFALDLGKLAHARVVNEGCESNMSIATALVSMYAKSGSIEQAVGVFKVIRNPDVVSWTTLITGFTHNSLSKEAIALFNQMLLHKVKPNDITFITTLDACASVAALKQGKLIHAYIVHQGGMIVDIALGNALVNMYGKCGVLANAKSSFDAMPIRDVISWTTMISAYSLNGEGESALGLFKQMVSKGVKPNDITFVSVLSACTHAGLLDEGLRCFVSMYQDYGMVARVDHYMCMIDLLGRAGALDEAEHLIRSMPFEPSFELHAMAWMCLLGACRNHSEMDLGSCAAEHLFELDPKQG